MWRTAGIMVEACAHQGGGSNAFRMDHTAVLLAGGKSSRMGRDKALLAVEGRPLWMRQVEVLRATSPTQLLISGPPDGAWKDTGIVAVADETPGQGPLSGIAR